MIFKWKKLRFQHEYSYILQLISKPIRNKISKIFYIGKSITVKKTLYLTNKKFTEDDKILCIYFNFIIYFI